MRKLVPWPLMRLNAGVQRRRSGRERVVYQPVPALVVTCPLSVTTPRLHLTGEPVASLLPHIPCSSFADLADCPEIAHLSPST